METNLFRLDDIRAKFDENHESWVILSIEFWSYSQILSYITIKEENVKI